MNFVFVYNNEQRQLTANAVDALAFVKANIDAKLQEPYTLMSSMSHSVRRMLVDGADAQAVFDYLQSYSDKVIKDPNRKVGMMGAFGHFAVFGGAYFFDGGWAPPADFDLEDRPWYAAAGLKG